MENNDAIELIIKKEKDYYTLGFCKESSFNMLIYSLAVGSLNEADIEILSGELDVLLEDGYLHISYFSNKLTDIISLKDLIRFKKPLFLNEGIHNIGMLLNNNGQYSDIRFSVKDTVHNTSEQSESESVEFGQIIQVIKPDGTYIDVAEYNIKSGSTVELKEKINLASGIYFLTIKGDTTGKIYHQKVVIIQ